MSVVFLIASLITGPSTGVTWTERVLERRARELGSVPSAQAPATGRIVVTVTTLEGTVQMSGMQVEVRQADGTVLARTLTDAAGQVAFPDIPPGRYSVNASRPGFVSTDSPSFDVRAGQSTEVLLDTRLMFEMPAVEVHADRPSPTDSVQPVSMSDMLAGSVLESSPLAGDDFQSLLPLLPGVVRDADGRLRIKGGQPTQGALQVSSASLIDPSTGEFDLDLPGQSIESVEVLSNPFAAEYGRFSTSVTQIRTRRGSNAWEVRFGNLVPRLRKSLTIRAFEPRFSARGPLVRDRLFLSQDVQFRHVNTPVRSLPDEPEITVTSFDSFTRFDLIASARHSVGGGLITYPREVSRATMNTFRPPEVTPGVGQSGWSTGALDRFAIGPDLVLETTVATRWFEVEVDSQAQGPMVYAPETQSGAFYNDQERNVISLQIVEALSLMRDLWRGQHVFKVGMDLQRSEYSGRSVSRPVEVRRADGTLAERTTFDGPSEQDVAGTELAFFVQDRWRLGARLTLEIGLRLDRDPVVGDVNVSPRAGLALGVLPDGRGILRGGWGNFVQRTPLNVGAFPSFEPRRVARFRPDGTPLGPPVLFSHVVERPLNAPEADVLSAEWDQRFGRRLLVKLAALDRRGRHEYLLLPDARAGELRVASAGASRYREVEATTRYLGGERRDLTVSYVWSRGTAELNNYDQFYGNVRNPLVRANGSGRIPTDVPHRLLVRGTIGVAGGWDVAPVLELRSGFPWSAVDEYQDFVGPRNGAGRLPAVRTLDLQITRPWQFRKYRFRAGLRLFNVFGAEANRDVQTSLASPFYGQSFNPIERSIGVTVSSVR